MKGDRFAGLCWYAFYLKSYRVERLSMVGAPDGRFDFRRVPRHTINRIPTLPSQLVSITMAVLRI